MTLGLLDVALKPVPTLLKCESIEAKRRTAAPATYTATFGIFFTLPFSSVGGPSNSEAIVDPYRPCYRRCGTSSLSNVHKTMQRAQMAELFVRAVSRPGTMQPAPHR